MDPIINIPQVISNVGIVIIFLLISALFVEVHYIGRISLATNVFLLWQLLGPFWYSLPNFFQAYMNLGLILAIIAIISYIFEQSLPAGFYNIGRLFFGSFTVLGIVLYFFYIK